MSLQDDAIGLARGVMGGIDRDETWGGTIQVAGSVVIAEGASLRVSAGTRIIFSGNEETSLSVFGRLLIEGTESSPVVIGGPGLWGGIHVLPKGRLQIANCRLEGTPGVHIACRGGTLDLSRCTLIGGACGIDIVGGSHRIEEFRIQGVRAALVLARAKADIRDLRVSGCSEVLAVREGSEVMIDGASANDGDTALAVTASRVILRHAHFRHFAQMIGAAEGGWARLEDCRLEGASAVNVSSRASSLELERCALSGGSCGVDLKGGSHQLVDVKITDARAGLAAAQAVLSARGLRLTGCSEALSVQDGSEAEFVDTSLSDGETGLVAGASKIILREMRFENFSKTALSLLSKAVLSAEDCRVSRCHVGMILAGERSEFKNLHLDECQDTGVYAPRGTHLLNDYHGPDIIFEEPSRVERDGRPLARARPTVSHERSWIMRLVLKTQDIKPLRGLYRAVYSMGETVFRFSARLAGNVAACDTWRGWKRGDWKPGISDLDFIVIARDLSGEAGKRWLQGFWRRYARLKRAIPFLGEAMVLLENERRDYFDFGGIRALELPGTRRSRPSAPDNKPRLELALWTECAYSYSRLIEWLSHRGGYPWESRRVQIFKSALDILRHLPADKNGFADIRSSRRLFWRDIGLTPFGDFRADLQALLDSDTENLPAELWARLLKAMHHGAERALDFKNPAADGDLTWMRPPPTGNADGHGASLERWSPQIHELRDKFGEGLSGVLLSDLYPSYAILGDTELSKPDLGRSLAACAGDKSQLGFTMILSRRLWELWSCLPFFENPVLFMDAETARAGRLIPMRGQFSWGDTSAPRPPAPLLRESARQALAHLRLARRWLGSPTAALDGRGATHYLLSRSMGLRLLSQRGIASPFFDLDFLSQTYLREFPQAAGMLAGITAETGERTVDQSYGACHDFVESALSGGMN